MSFIPDGSLPPKLTKEMILHRGHESNGQEGIKVTPLCVEINYNRYQLIVVNHELIGLAAALKIVTEFLEELPK